MNRLDLNESREEKSSCSGLPVPGVEPGVWGLALDAIRDGVTIHSREGKILYANRGVADIYGIAAQDLIGLECGDVFHNAGQSCSHERIMTSSEGAVIESDLQRSGRYYRVILKKIVDPDNVNLGYIRIMLDLSERKRTLESLQNAERLTALEQMISGLAHDIGTPLNIISGYSEYLMMRTLPEEKGYKELSTMLEQTRRIGKFIKQMLDLIRPVQGRIDAIAMECLFSETLDLVMPHFRKRQIAISQTCEKNLPLIYGDGPRLRLAIFTVLINICQEIDPGSSLKVRIENASDNDSSIYVILQGFEGEGKRLNFQKQLSPCLESGNLESGRGLFLAKEILDEFRAEVRTDNPGGQASEILIIFPINQKKLGDKGEQ